MKRFTNFITFEGGEGVGKTTLIRRLEAELAKLDYKTLSTREPGGSALGEQIRLLLLNQSHQVKIASKAELLLFLAARVQHLDEVIRPALEAGKVVLCDRFNDSSVAYQGIARGLGQEDVQKLCDQVCEGATPAVTFFLDLDPAVGLQRVHRSQRVIDRLESEEHKFHEKVRQGYLKLAKEHPERIVVIDASLPPDEVFKKVWTILRKALKGCSGDKPLPTHKDVC